MAGKLRKDKGRDEFDLPPPLITDANREAMEASGVCACVCVCPSGWRFAVVLA